MTGIHDAEGKWHMQKVMALRQSVPGARARRLVCLVLGLGLLIQTGLAFQAGALTADELEALRRKRIGKPAQSGPAPDQGMTSPTHQKYVGKLVFLKRDQTLNQVDEAMFTSQSTLGEPLYYRVFLAASSVNSLRARPGGEKLGSMARPDYLLSFHLDGQSAYELPMHLALKPEDHARWTTWRGAFRLEDSLRGRPDVYLPGETEFIEFLAAKEAALTPGKHRLKLELRPVYREPGLEIQGDVMASGELDLNVPADWAGPATSWLCLPRAQQHDAGLEGKMLADFSAKHPGETPLKVAITMPAWSVERNQQTGRILRRTTSAAIGSKKGNQCRMQIYDFSQEHLGSAFSAETYLSFRGKVQHRIPCGCLK